MCGIAGIVMPAELVEKHRPQRLIQRMIARLSHRGPDDAGSWNQTAEYHHVSFGHTRLAILDLSGAARQPMVDPVSGCVLIYNGEVYNFPEIRDDLEKEGEAFRSTGDTEVVLKGYVRWGKDAIRRFRGMFAIAVFDPQENRLLLARDPFGVKPLYYTEDWAGRFAFSSEVRPLLELPWVSKQLDLIGLVGYLSYGAVQEPLTLVSGIRSLLPGHTLTISLGQRISGLEDPERYWRMPVQTTRSGSFDCEEAAGCLRKALASSVRRHLVSDAPAGVFLSGGLDSSAITALMCEAANSRVRALTVSFADAGYQDSAVAREIAGTYGLEHMEVRLSAGDLLSSWDMWLGDQDQPSSDGANTWVISRACRRAGIRVALSGLGADELFVGYNTFTRAAAALRWSNMFELPTGLREHIAAEIGRVNRMSAQKIAEWLRTDGSLLACYLCLRRVMTKSHVGRLLHPVAMNTGGAELNHGVMHDLLTCAEDCDPISAVSMLEASTYMVSTLMRDSDQMGMAHSVEIRVPFVDREVAESAWQFPGAMHAAHGPKSLLQLAMRDRLRPSWVNRPKEAFLIPFDRWLKKDLRLEVENALSSVRGFPFRGDSVRRAWAAFLNGDHSVNSSQILSLVSLARWMQRHDIRTES